MKTLGVVLAGGRSTRMGVDKARLPWGATTLLEHAVSLLRDVTDEVVISGDAAGHASVPDVMPGAGPMGGVASVLRAARGDVALFIPVDMPRLRPGRLRALLAALTDGGEVVAYDGRELPFACRVSAGNVARALTVASSEARALHRFLALSAVRWLPLAGDLTEFTNLNTPDDWEAVQP